MKGGGSCSCGARVLEPYQVLDVAAQLSVASEDETLLLHID
jgi:hypothetical protein